MAVLKSGSHDLWGFSTPASPRKKRCWKSRDICILKLSCKSLPLSNQENQKLRFSLFFFSLACLYTRGSQFVSNLHILKAFGNSALSQHFFLSSERLENDLIMFIYIISVKVWIFLSDLIFIYCTMNIHSTCTRRYSIYADKKIHSSIR